MIIKGLTYELSENRNGGNYAVIRKGDTFFDDNGHMIQINAPHFGDYAVSIYDYNDDTEDYDIFYGDTIYTAREVSKLAKAKGVVWSED